MRKQFVRTGSVFPGLLRCAVILSLVASAVIIGFFIGQGAEAAQRGQGSPNPQAGQQAQAAPRGQANAPAPCGPKANLPAELGRNVAPDSRCFEIRMYTVDPTRDGVGQFRGGINELHQRFREKEVELVNKNGGEIVAVWQHLSEPDTLIWMIAFRDEAHRQQVWAAFSADPEWNELRLKYFVPLTFNTFLMSAADYSPMK